MRRITNFPLDVAVGDEGRLYILCRNDGAAVIRVWSFDDAERLTDDLIDIGGYGSNEGQFTWPVNVIRDADENVYVSDEALHRISSFTKDGEFIGCWGEEGGAEGQINGPAGIEFDAEENMYIVDSLNHRVQKFTRDGEYILGWGSQGDGPGEFNMPWGVTVDEVGDVYIADWRNDRVQKFTADGEFISEFGTSGSGKGEFNRPTGVAVDKFGDIYVADTGNNRIQLFKREGRVRPEVHRRRDPVTSGPRLHADQRLPQQAARHGRSGDPEALPRSEVGPRERRAHVRRRLPLVPGTGLQERGHPAERRADVRADEGAIAGDGVAGVPSTLSES